MQSVDVIMTWTNCEGKVLNEHAQPVDQKAHVSHGFLFLQLITLTTCSLTQILPCGSVPIGVHRTPPIVNRCHCAQRSTPHSPGLPVHIQCKDCVTTVASSVLLAKAPWSYIYLESPFDLLWCFIFPTIILAVGPYPRRSDLFLLVWAKEHLKECL